MRREALFASRLVFHVLYGLESETVFKRYCLVSVSSKAQHVRSPRFLLYDFHAMKCKAPPSATNDLMASFYAKAAIRPNAAVMICEIVSNISCLMPNSG